MGPGNERYIDERFAPSSLGPLGNIPSRGAAEWPEGVGMHLATLRIENFRCFGSSGITIEFQAGMNVILGENNVGKTAIVDALRLLFSLGPGRRDVYVQPQDFYCAAGGEPAHEIRLDAIFEGLSNAEQGVFYELLVPGPPVSAQVHLRFRLETVGGQSRVRQTVWGGEVEGQPVPPAVWELVSHMYLGALRDAESDLRPQRGGRVGHLVKRVISDPVDRARVEAHVRQANRFILAEGGIQRTAEMINDHLSELAGNELRQSVRISLGAPAFERVADTLRLLLPQAGESEFVAVYDVESWKELRQRAGANANLLDRVSEDGDRVLIRLGHLGKPEQEKLGELYAELLDHVEPFGVDQNGMGYNNLIYMGVVLGDLVERRKAGLQNYSALLIEEPEAHIHPQLQVLVYDFLSRTSVIDDAGNQVQVFVTSHSPTLTSRASLDSLIVMHRAEGRVTATALRRCPLDENQKADLRRYLDVTRSQLLFSRAVVLVEGISEALLFPVLAKRAGYRFDHSAVEVVAVAGVSFAPFAALFNSDEPARRLHIPCALVTDDDRCAGELEPSKLRDAAELMAAGRVLAAGRQSDRSSKAAELEGGTLKVFRARKTLEVELGMFTDNLEPIAEAVEGCGHPTVARNLREQAATLDFDWGRAAAVWARLSGMKAAVAQRLAALLDEGTPVRTFVVPDYLSAAAKHVARRGSRS